MIPRRKVRTVNWRLLMGLEPRKDDDAFMVGLSKRPVRNTLLAGLAGTAWGLLSSLRCGTIGEDWPIRECRPTVTVAYATIFALTAGVSFWRIQRRSGRDF